MNYYDFYCKHWGIIVVFYIIIEFLNSLVPGLPNAASRIINFLLIYNMITLFGYIIYRKYGKENNN